MIMLVNIITTKRASFIKKRPQKEAAMKKVYSVGLDIAKMFFRYLPQINTVDKSPTKN